MKGWVLRIVYPHLRAWLADRALVVPLDVRSRWARQWDVPQYLVDALCERVRNFVLSQLDQLAGYERSSDL